jgi:putative RNA 2'-phosphotransferase
MHPMNEKDQVKKGKFLSLVLRHNPDKIKIKLDEEGWTDVTVLLQQMKKFNREISFEELDYLVENNPKKRYSFNKDKSKIRANQGHSVQVDLGLKSVSPPDVLFHGTADRFLESIREKGLVKMNRHHVHLSADEETASKVGKRHGRLVMLKVDSKRMADEGFDFYLSENGVWLTDHVPSQFLSTHD